MKPLGTVWQLIDSYGLPWTVARMIYELQARSRFQVVRFRRRMWADDELAHWLRPGVPSDPDGYAAYWQEHRPPFLFRPADRPLYGRALREILGEEGIQALVGEAEQLKQGRFQYFFSQSGRLGFPPDWHHNPFTNQRTSPTAHWSRIPMFSSETGDLKFIWEPGRFASAYTLARAYWASGDEAYAETFWQLVESWARSNPPNHGAHWRCGQEISLRLMAWCFGLYAFAESPATTPDRLFLMAGMIAVQADRVAKNHVYAYLQRNNHAISEGVGLWTAGILFPEFREAEKWRESGRKFLEEEARRQIYDDGAYVQHSTNYHRLMLHDYLWAIRLGELAGYELSPLLMDRVYKAGELLYQLQDEESGYVPNYGANDGALILPLNICDYKDFRPVLGSIHYLFRRTRLYQHGPWEEDLLWLFGPEAIETQREVVEKKPLQASIGGYYTLRAGKSWGMTRCVTFQDRPSDADMLHLDIWRNGVNVACDPGSYRYFAEPAWDKVLSSTQVHNTVSVDGEDQMERGPRFMRLTWTESKMYYHLTAEENRLAYFEGVHYGYRRLRDKVTHRRAVLKGYEDTWIIVDDMFGDGKHDFRLHWLLADLPFTVDMEEMHVSVATGEDTYGLYLRTCLPESVPGQFDVIRGTEDSAPRGWQSSYYGVRHPALSVALSLSATVPCRLVSVFAPEKQKNQLLVSPKRIHFENCDSRLMANLLAPESASIVQDVILDSPAGREHFVIG